MFNKNRVPPFLLNKQLFLLNKPKVTTFLVLLRVNASKNQRNRGHSSKFNFARTLSIGRPKSDTYDKDVRWLTFSLVWEKSS